MYEENRIFGKIGPMILRDALQRVKGFRYVVEQLELCSPVGRRCLYDSPWMDSKGALEMEFERIRQVCALGEQPASAAVLEGVEVKLMQVRDIRGTVKRTATASVLDDLELFELKHFALLVEDIREMVRMWPWVELPDLKELVGVLDPEGNRLPHFYVYDAYDPELAEIRSMIRQRSQQGDSEEELAGLYEQEMAVENRVREDLSVRLRAWHARLQQALEGIGMVDMILAKAKLTRQWQLVCPTVQEEGDLVLEGLFHPQVQAVLNREGKDFQAVDICLSREAAVITGANMAGKTVLLKSVQLVQYLTQFGFYVPARKAVVPLVERVLTSIGDEQDELNGLSSFAAEMLVMNDIVDAISQHQRVLVLIDELARTTNPQEGRAIVNGMVDFLSSHRVMAMVTTHYGGITAACRKWRVRGVVENRFKGEMTLNNINEFMDYSLEADDREDVPHEAIRIAWMLGIDRELLERVENYLQEEEGNSCLKKTVQ